jgi:hypothetical protein
MILEGKEAVTELEYIGGTNNQFFLIRDEPRGGGASGASGEEEEEEDPAEGEGEWRDTTINPKNFNMKPESASMTNENTAPNRGACELSDQRRNDASCMNNNSVRRKCFHGRKCNCKYSHSPNKE